LKATNGAKAERAVAEAESELKRARQARDPLEADIPEAKRRLFFAKEKPRRRRARRLGGGDWRGPKADIY